MAMITRTRLIVSSVALILMTTTMLPTTTDARGGGGFGGHGGGFRVGRPGTVHTTGPSIPGPATVRRSFASSPNPVASSSTPFSQRNGSFRRSRRIGSHFLTLGTDGVWVDNFGYAPTVLIAEQPMPVQQQSVHRHTPVARTPSATQEGVIVVRGNSKSYVTFSAAQSG
ncbi:MAG TPA: hypothetical protein VG328_04525 [Stellaceae bacterium]|jgi:hypothetical protein|nr:hypothetical protein [Stellaceae bacterium]